MKLVILITALLFAYSQQQCNPGCLMCNASNQCLACDFKNNFVLTANTCTNSTQTNCQTLAFNGNCAVCNSKYYLDITTQKCLSISNTTSVTNCLYYSSTQACTLCNANYYISAGQCVAANVTVANCQYYSANGVCSDCATGYIFSNDFTSCVAITAISNCHQYSYAQCFACKDNFVLNKNYYLVSNFQYSLTSFAFLVANIAGIADRVWSGVSVCQAVSFSNCIQYTTFDKCLKCAEGYYLSSGNCFAFPLAIINGCTIYTSLVTCSQCAQGMYLKSSVLCENVVPITNCTTYSQSASSTVCTTCITGYYVNNNACAVRVNSLSIASCLTVALLSDTCSACNTGFTLTSDSRLCLASLSNCLTYTSSTYQSTTLTCVSCEQGYYLVTTAGATSCSAGTVQNCAIYQASANTCTQCVNGYYLVGQTCTQHVSITNCLTYDPTNANTCKVCTQGYYTFSLQTVCQTVTVITNCSVYNAAGNQCATCATGYYLTATYSCSLISPSLNCSTMSTAGVCTQCIATYVLNSNVCILPFDYVTVNCDEYAFTASTTMTGGTAAVCTTCKQNYIPYNFVSQAICVQNTQLTYLGLTTLVTNCVKYSSAATPLCLQCATGYVFDQTLATPACATSCSALSILILDNLNGQINNCYAQNAFSSSFTTGTTKVARVSLYAQIGNGAATFAKADFRVIAVDTATYSLKYLFNQAFVSELALPYDYTATINYQPTMVNEQTNAVEPIATASVTAVSNCKLYYAVGASNYCLQCAWGYQLAITNAPVYSCSSWAGCNSAIVYSGLSSFIYSVTSCYACSTAGQYVQVKVMFPDQVTTYFEKLYTPSSGSSNAIDCYTPASAVANCAIYAKIYDNAGSVVTADACMGCALNYKPTYDATLTAKVTACTAITYASSTNTYAANGALSCATQIVAGQNVYYAFSDYTRTLCRASSTNNCFIVDSSQVCQVCNSGYWLTSDNVCDPISSPNCSQNMFSSPYVPNVAAASDTASQ